MEKPAQVALELAGAVVHRDHRVDGLLHAAGRPVARMVKVLEVLPKGLRVSVFCAWRKMGCSFTPRAWSTVANCWTVMVMKGSGRASRNAMSSFWGKAGSSSGGWGTPGGSDMSSAFTSTCSGSLVLMLVGAFTSG